MKASATKKRSKPPAAAAAAAAAMALITIAMHIGPQPCSAQHQKNYRSGGSYGQKEATNLQSLKRLQRMLQTKTLQSYRPQPLGGPLLARTGRRTAESTLSSGPMTAAAPKATSPHLILSSIIEKNAGGCGVRKSSYLPHDTKGSKSNRVRKQLSRRGRIIWEDDESLGAIPAPEGTFPWMASLFMLLPGTDGGEALFMCAGAILTSNTIVTAAHCFTGGADNPSLWFVRVGDNYILRPDAKEQTFRVKKIIKHPKFDPLAADKDEGGDGRHDIAILVLQRSMSRVVRGLDKDDAGLIAFSDEVTPICPPPQQDQPVIRLQGRHCEIAGWGMTEYNNSASYPDSVRAAKITVGNVPERYCNYLYNRDVASTGKFCAGGKVDACQEDSGGPLVCRLDDGRYHLIGIVSSGKGCGVYPGLYTQVSLYVDWLAYWIQRETPAVTSSS